MNRFTVAPSLVLDDEMYELALDALGQCAPEQVAGFTWNRFIDRESWRLIPDVANPDEPFFKAECKVKHGPPYEQTIKLNVWRSPDLRRDGAPVPHNHPYRRFRSRILRSGYTEDRYTVHDGRVELERDCLHQAGGVNDMPHDVFHEVTSVLEPGRTLTLMDCGPSKKEYWGYLDPDTGLYTPNKKSPIDPRFKMLLLDRNPHLRK